MSREYNVESTLVLWDYIFAGILDSQEGYRGRSGAITDYDEFDLKAPQDDPFVNLEFLSVAMIALIREDLLESDISMCLGLLMSYKVPEDPLIVIKKAQKVRDAYLYAAPYHVEARLKP
jgi:hypothetical protein